MFNKTIKVISVISHQLLMTTVFFHSLLSFLRLQISTKTTENKTLPFIMTLAVVAQACEV